MSFENEKIVETKSCQKCQASFDVTDKDLEFYKQVSPVFDKVKYDFPSPVLCPDCRMQKRMSFRNERKLYKRKCDFTGKTMVSMFPPEVDYKVYHHDVWYSDRLEALEYGRDFDFNKNFFEQFADLKKQVPMMSLYNFYGVNSEYCNCAGHQKNGYLVFASAHDEDCMYCSYVNDSEKCLDCLMTHESQNCYQALDCRKCFEVFYSRDCIDCSSCWYSSDLINCSNCYRCSNLVGKSYCIENKQYSKKEYSEMLQSGDLKKETKGGYKKYMSGNMNENVLGNYITSSKNTHHCFDVYDLEDCKYNIWFSESKSCCDNYSWGLGGQNMYENVAIGIDSSNVAYSANIFGPASDILYCMFGLTIKNCFGCVGLKNKQYCIFNKQYTKQEYNILVPKIIEHMKTTDEWGNFFPRSFSPFAYNSTVASDYYPLGKSDALKQGFGWSDYETPHPDVEKTIPASQLPDDITDIPDDILTWAIECEVTGQPFQITPDELKFYRRYNLPVPRIHPDRRNLDRIQLRNPRKLYKRNCDKCDIELQTTYAPDRPEAIYCEDCYNEKTY